MQRVPLGDAFGFFSPKKRDSLISSEHEQEKMASGRGGDSCLLRRHRRSSFAAEAGADLGAIRSLDVELAEGDVGSKP